MKSPLFSLAVDKNQLGTCAAPGCALHRYSISQFCKDHHQQALRYGHPHARPLKPAQWAKERAAVRHLLESNPDHPGLVQVLELLASWSALAVGNDAAFKGAEEIARLARHGIKPLDILTEVAACRAWTAANPNALPSDKARDFAISRAVFALSPRPRRFTRGPGGYWPVTAKARLPSYSPKARPSALAYVGAHLRAVLAPFLANISGHLEAAELRKVHTEAAMRAPFRTL